MGTSGFVAFRHKNKTTKGMLNYQDSYPTGIGEDIAAFIRSCSKADLERMASLIDDLKWWVKKEDEPDWCTTVQYISAGYTYGTTSMMWAQITGMMPNFFPSDTVGSTYQSILQRFIERVTVSLEAMRTGPLRHLIMDGAHYKDIDKGVYLCFVYILDFHARQVEILDLHNNKQDAVVSFDYLKANRGFMAQYEEDTDF